MSDPVTTPPVDEAVERLRAALADLAVGQKVKLFPADVRALLGFYDVRSGTAAPASEEDATAAVHADPAAGSSPGVIDSLEDLRTALDRLIDLGENPSADDRSFRVLHPLIRAVQGIILREADALERTKVNEPNDAREAVAAADGNEDGVA